VCHACKTKQEVQAFSRQAVFLMKKIPMMFALVFLFTLPWWCAPVQGQRVGAQDDGAGGTAAGRVTAGSQQEYDDYQAARRPASGLAADKAAGDFARKYPESELRRYLFSRALGRYQSENNPAGMLAMAERVLALDPKDPLALVLTATVVADGLSAGDPDRQPKMDAVRKYAARALQVLDVDAADSAQARIHRSTLRAMAYSALGVMELKTGDDAGAEKDLRTSANLPKARPDPYVWYHLALAQDHRKKYPAALNSVEQALQLASANPKLQRLAETEHERLNRLTGRDKEVPESGGTGPP
jgi:tetratricopeptide (TPR) repeat protein